MSAAQWCYGACLPTALRRQVLAIFVNRVTAEHVPAWARKAVKSGKMPIRYASDLEWLHNTEFAITKTGELDRRVRHCTSHDPKAKAAGA